MSPFTPLWPPDALDMLTDVWLASNNRAAVTAAQARVDRLLAQDPYGNGQEVSEDLYVLVVAPLVINYVIDDANKNVTVTHVRRLP